MRITTTLSEFEAEVRALRGKPKTPALQSELTRIQRPYLARLLSAGLNVPRAMRLLHSTYTGTP